MNANEIYSNNLSRFTVVHRNGKSAQCKCPAHNDNQASLTITQGNKCTLFHCHAGCNTGDILAAVGLDMKDTFYETNVKAPDWRAYVEKREGLKIEAVYNYVSCNGDYCFTKLRLTGKVIKYGILTNGLFSYNLPRNKPRKSYGAMYGDLDAIKRAVRDGSPVFVPEGEKDVDTLKMRGYAAITYGGVNDWQENMKAYLQNANVYILADNDKPGKAVAQKIYDDIADVAKSRSIIVPMPDVDKADVSDYFTSGKTMVDFERLLLEASTEPLQETVSEMDGLVKKLHELDAANSYQTSDKGFGELYANIFKDKHRYNPQRKEFMQYDGKRWVDDLEGLEARKDAKKLADALMQYGIEINAQSGRDSYIKAVSALVNIRNRENMLKDAKDAFPFNNEQLDTEIYILNVQNGTLDLTDNEPRFLEHSPDMLLSKIGNVNYDPAAICPEWEKFMNEIMQGDYEKVKYLQKIAGLSLTGNTQEETCFILYGSTTRNGKSTFCETLIHLLGDYAVSMRPESLAVKQNNDSRQANGDIARLAGCRFCNASEPPKRMLFDTALLKVLTGRDSITARHLHQREFEFKPVFKLVINTNYLPTITDDTVFSSQRINVVSFDRHFKPEEQDKHLKDRLQASGELSGILNWCIDGLRLYRAEGLKPPAAVQQATETYRSDSDKIGNFIKECLCRTGKNSTVKDVYSAYSNWCAGNGFGTESKANFVSELKTKGLYASTATVKGKTVHNAVKGYEIDAEFATDGAESTPFDS